MERRLILGQGQENYKVSLEHYCQKAKKSLEINGIISKRHWIWLKRTSTDHVLNNLRISKNNDNNKLRLI